MTAMFLSRMLLFYQYAAENLVQDCEEGQV